MVSITTRRVPSRRARTDAARTLAPTLLAVGWGAVLLTLLGQGSAPATVERYAFVPLLVGIVLLGLPHGALDHLVPARMGLRWARRPLGLALYLLAYLALAAATFALWLTAPLAAFVVFLAATWWHWGQGDLRFLEIFTGRDAGSPAGRMVTLLLRGALPMALPVLAFPDTAESLYRHAAAGLGVEGAAGIDLAAPWLRAALLAVLVGLGSLYLLEARRAAPSAGALALDLGEIALLTLLFTQVPAYMAIGVYFLAWHSLRHLGRLLLLRPRDAAEVAEGRTGPPAVRLARDLLPITVLALVLLAGVWLWAAPRLAGTGGPDVEGFVALYLVLISALTKPHLVVVALMDLNRAEGR